MCEERSKPEWFVVMGYDAQNVPFFYYNEFGFDEEVMLFDDALFLQKALTGGEDDSKIRIAKLTFLD